MTLTKTFVDVGHDGGRHHLGLAKDRLREVADIGIEGEIRTHYEALRQQQAQTVRIQNAWEVLCEMLKPRDKHVLLRGDIYLWFARGQHQ